MLVINNTISMYNIFKDYLWELIQNENSTIKYLYLIANKRFMSARVTISS